MHDMSVNTVMPGLVSSHVVGLASGAVGAGDVSSPPADTLSEAQIAKLCAVFRKVGEIYALSGWAAARDQMLAETKADPTLFTGMASAFARDPAVGDRLGQCATDGYYNARVKKESVRLKAAAIGGVAGVLVGIIIGAVASR